MKESLEGAREEMVGLRDEITHLASALESAKKTEKWHRRFIVLLSVATAAAIFSAFRVATQQDDIRDAANASAQTAATLQDCLLSSGDCYQRSVEMGRQGGVRQLKFNACMLLQLPENRSKNTANDCARFAYPEVPDLDLYENGGRR